MPKKPFPDEQISFALREAETRTTVGQICRKIGVAEATFNRWEKVYAGMGVSEIRHHQDVCALWERRACRAMGLGGLLTDISREEIQVLNCACG